jgi:Flp pilus assembly protein CpaB
MESQDVINALIATAGLLAGWFMRVMWTSIQDLQKNEKQVAEKVNQIEVLVAGNYIRRDDFNRLSDAIFKKLDSIDRKLDGKVDK